MDIQITLPGCNFDMLMQQLAAGGYPNMVSVAYPEDGTATVTLHFSDEATQTAIDAATAIVKKHDPTQMTDTQKAEQQQQQQVATLDSELTQIVQRLQTYVAAPAPTDVATLAAGVSAAFNDLIPIVTAIQVIMRMQQGSP
jgi:hypothetical protein